MELPIDKNPKDIGGHWTTNKSCFYHIPPCWVVDSFEPDGSGKKNGEYPNVLDTTLDCGVRVVVRQDGLFLFEFVDLESCKSVYIPEFKAAEGFRLKLPTKRQEADRKALEHAMNRCEFMNCFMACLNSAISIHERRATPVTQFSSPGDYLTDEINVFWKPLHAHFSINSKKVNRSYTLSQEALDGAIELMEQVAKSGQGCISVLNTMYQAHYLYSNLDFSNALLLAWMASEKLIGELFSKYLSAEEKFKGKRRKKLKDGRTFSAAIVLEMLELGGSIEEDLYKKLEEVRQARNKWIHSLDTVSSELASQSLRSSEELFRQVHSIDSRITVGYGISY